MRILNRPMFRYGGPIKEGVMHGMRNGGRAALVGNPMFPQRGGRALHAEQLELFPKIMQAIKQTVKTPPHKALNPLKKAGLLRHIPKWWARIKPTARFRQPSVTQHPGASFKYSPAPYSAKEIAKNPSLWWKAVKENPKWAAAAGYTGLTDPGQAVLGTVGKAAKRAPTWIAEALTPGMWEKHLPWMDKDDGGDDGTGTKTGIGEGAQFKESTAPIITASQREKLAKDQQNARLKSYLDMMGYDSAKKTAISDALIDASALVQDASTEAGSLKHADWGKLINKTIQTTSRRLDKPAQIREAVGLMMTKGEIEKDIAAGKGSPQRQVARDLVAAGVYKTEKEALSKLANVGSFEDTMAALASKTGKVTGDMIKVAWISDQKTPPRDHFKSTDKVYKDFKEKMEDAGNEYNIELKFVDKMIDDKKPGDAFVVDDTLVIVKSDGTLDYKWK